MVPQTSESLCFQVATELGWFVLYCAGHPISQTHKNVTLLSNNTTALGFDLVFLLFIIFPITSAWY